MRDQWNERPMEWGTNGMRDQWNGMEWNAIVETFTVYFKLQCICLNYVHVCVVLSFQTTCSIVEVHTRVSAHGLLPLHTLSYLSVPSPPPTSDHSYWQHSWDRLLTDSRSSLCQQLCWNTAQGKPFYQKWAETVSYIAMVICIPIPKSMPLLPYNLYYIAFCV